MTSDVPDVSVDGRYASANGLKIYYEEHGPDSRDLGRTEHPGGHISYELLAEDTIALIQAIGLESPFICGIADGAFVALQMAGSAIQKREQKQEHEEETGQHHHADPLQAAWEVPEQLKQEQEVPLRTRNVAGVGGVCLPLERRAECHGKCDDDEEDNGRDERVFDDQVRKEAAPAGLEFVIHRVVLGRGFRSADRTIVRTESADGAVPETWRDTHALPHHQEQVDCH